MKRLKTALILALVSMVLLACGSGGSGIDGGGSGGGNGENIGSDRFFINESIGISCIEVSNMDDYECTETELMEVAGLRVALDNGLVSDSIYNAGDVSKSEFVFYDLEATNGAFSPARLYIHIDEGGVNGCESRNLSTSLLTFDINQRAHKVIGTSGTNYDICAMNGASWANVTIYNGSHLALDMSGNPARDEALYTTTILWNFTD